MKLALLIILVLSSASAFCLPQQCVPVYYQNVDFFSVLVDSIDPTATVGQMSLNRSSAVQAFGTVVTSDGAKEIFEIRQQCQDGKLVANVSSNSMGYVCQTGYVDCMPHIGDDLPSMYCSNDFVAWSVKNCGGKPKLTH